MWRPIDSRFVSFLPLILCMLTCRVQIAVAQISLTINDRFQMELSTNEHPIVGVDIQSPSGSILPGEQSASGPFHLALAQTEYQVTLANLGADLVLTEPAKLPIRWNPAGKPDVWWQYGDGPNPIGPFSLFENPQIQKDPDISVSLDTENKFVLTGAGEEMIGITFLSESGSLVPGSIGDSGPFSVVYKNNAGRMAYGQVTSEQPLILDGSLTLPGGWNPFGENDVVYHYNLVGPIHSGSLPLEIGAPSRDRVQVSLDDEFRFVLAGSGQQLQHVSLRSASGSLIPAETSVPFQQLTENSPQAIVYSAEPSVTVDGQLTLNAKWNRNRGIQDVEFGYSETDFAIEAPLPASLYPTQVVRQPIDVRVNKDSTMLLRGNGQELNSIQFDSPSGSLRHDGQSVEPFQALAESSETRVTFETSEFVTVDGQLTLPIEYALGSGNRDLQYRYTQVGMENRQGPFAVTFPFAADPIRSWIDVEGYFWVQGTGHNVSQLEFTSPTGALSPGESPVPFEQFVEPSAERVELLGDVVLDGRIKLDIRWDELKSADVRFEYNLVDDTTDYGPFFPGYPSPNEITILAAPELTDAIKLIGEDQVITSVEISSVSGSLRLLETLDPNTGLLPDSPFDIIEAYTEERVVLRSTTGVVIDDVRLPIMWESNGEADLVAAFEHAGSRVIVPRFAYIAGIALPEPESSTLLAMLIPALFSLRVRRRKRLRFAA